MLDAAERVLVERGAGAFTLDAVAETAGVSKGGLIYHFASKEALLEALVVRAVEAFDALLAPAASSDEPGAFARAWLDGTVPRTAGRAAASSGAFPALAAAVLLDPRLLVPLRAAYERWQLRLETDGIDAAAATAVRLAVDGWWTATLLGLPPLSADVHRRTRQLLEDLTAGRGR